jgi:arylsulfatase A-like enzyme
MPEKVQEIPKKPNILVIWGDDIGIVSLSCYSHGLMGYHTPNIDRLAKEGMLFTDSYGKQSCTEGRTALFTGHSVFRTGLSEVGLPGAALGLQAEDPSIAELLKPQGYATGQFGKNQEPRSDRVGREKIEDTGPLTRKRMETCDDEFVGAAKDWIKRQVMSETPFFCWVNTPSSLEQAGPDQSPYHDTMIGHDKNVGELLDLLDELKITNNTFVVYSTDKGPHMNTWPDGAMTPFPSEKDTNGEGAFRVPLLVRWPGKIPAGMISNEIVQHHDWLPTFLAMAGEPDIVEKCEKGHKAGDKTFKLHLDGYNLLPYLTGREKKSPRGGFIYFDDDGNLVAARYGNRKLVFLEQRCEGTLRIWAEPFVVLRFPKLFNLRSDPFERVDITSNTYYSWLIDGQERMTT